EAGHRGNADVRLGSDQGFIATKVGEAGGSLIAENLHFENRRIANAGDTRQISRDSNESRILGSYHRRRIVRAEDLDTVRIRHRPSHSFLTGTSARSCALLGFERLLRRNKDIGGAQNVDPTNAWFNRVLSTAGRQYDQQSQVRQTPHSYPHFFMFPTRKIVSVLTDC